MISRWQRDDASYLLLSAPLRINNISESTQPHAAIFSYCNDEGLHVMSHYMYVVLLMLNALTCGSRYKSYTELEMALVAVYSVHGILRWIHSSNDGADVHLYPVWDIRLVMATLVPTSGERVLVRTGVNR